MQMNRKLIHIWYNVDKKHLLFTKRKCHKFSWLFTASRCSPRKRSICACRIACKVLVSIGLYSLRFGFLKKGWILHFVTLQESIAFHLKTSLTFKCPIEHLLADFSYSPPLDTYLWKQMMKMNRNVTYKWCTIAKKHLLFTKRKCHKFSWLFTASRYSPRRRSICACGIACKVLVSIGL